ncbi:MAG: STAUR_1299 family protein [Myxococcaceae bacterium]|nr:STAUR_1299 family protein [Myxococcaceae bacterium]
MSDVVGQLVARAFARADAARANVGIDEVRAQVEAETGAPAFSYELFVPRANVEAFFVEQALPKLVYFLSCRGLRTRRTPGVFVSLFTDDGLLFLHAGDVVEVVGQRRGLSVDDCFRRYADGGTGDPKALGAG